MINSMNCQLFYGKLHKVMANRYCMIRHPFSQIFFSFANAAYMIFCPAPSKSMVTL